MCEREEDRKRRRLQGDIPQEREDENETREKREMREVREEQKREKEVGKRWRGAVERGGSKKVISHFERFFLFERDTLIQAGRDCAMWHDHISAP